MLSRTHNIVAFAALSSAVVYFAPTDIKTSTFILSLVANAVGALLPDIDQASNKLWGLLPFGNTFARYFNKAFLTHRGFTHSILGFWLVEKLIFGGLSGILNGTYVNIGMVYWSLMIGYISHLVADGITEEGLPLFFPLKYKFGLPPIKAMRIKTGGWFENLVITPTLVFFILWLLVVYWPIFSKIF